MHALAEGFGAPGRAARPHDGRPRVQPLLARGLQLQLVCMWAAAAAAAAANPAAARDAAAAHAHMYANCQPDVVILGMARSGTSELRLQLGEFDRVDVGTRAEYWEVGMHKDGPINRVPTTDDGPGSQAHAAKNYKRCGCGTQRVASAPWAFDLGAEELRAHVHVHTQRSPCPVTFVLLLRDPIERMISSFHKLTGDHERKKDLQVLTKWANSNSGDRCRRWPISKADGGRHRGFPGLDRNRTMNYYTTDVKRAYHTVVAATVGHRLVVGFTEEHGTTVTELQRRFGWTPCGVDGACDARGQHFKHQARNAAPRNGSWPGLDAAAEAVAECEVEQLRFLAQLRSHANGTAALATAPPAHVIFAGMADARRRHAT